jgi:hypothetical protein
MKTKEMFAILVQATEFKVEDDEGILAGLGITEKTCDLTLRAPAEWKAVCEEEAKRRGLSCWTEVFRMVVIVGIKNVSKNGFGED